MKVDILPNRDYVEGDPVNAPTPILFFQDGSSTQPRLAERAPAEQRQRPRKVDREANRQPMEDDPVPF